MNVEICRLVEGLMAFWEEIEGAAVYHFHLIIGDLN